MHSVIIIACMYLICGCFFFSFQLVETCAHQNINLKTNFTSIRFTLKQEKHIFYTNTVTNAKKTHLKEQFTSVHYSDVNDDHVQMKNTVTVKLT